MKAITFSLLTLICGAANAQSYPQQITYKKALQPSLVLLLPNKPAIAEQTILQKLKETGYNPSTKGTLFWKKNKQDGFYVFPGVQLPELNNQKLDLYFKVDDKDSANTKSAITLMVSKGYDNFVAPSDAETYAASENFLNSFIAKTADFKLTKDTDAQRQKVKEFENKWQSTRNKQEDTRKKIAQLQADLNNMQQEEIKQKTELDIQRSALQSLEGQLTNSSSAK